MKSPTLFLKLRNLILSGINNLNDDHIDAFVIFFKKKHKTIFFLIFNKKEQKYKNFKKN